MGYMLYATYFTIYQRCCNHLKLGLPIWLLNFLQLLLSKGGCYTAGKCYTTFKRGYIIPLLLFCMKLHIYESSCE